MRSGEYRIDDVTNNAVILLRNHLNDRIALANMGVAESVQAREMICELVKNYVSQSPHDISDVRNSVYAFVIGGEYREHKKTIEGKIVYVDHKMARLKAVEALGELEIKVTSVPADTRAVKTVHIKDDGSFELDERREGLNRNEAEMSETEYEMTKTMS